MDVVTVLGVLVLVAAVRGVTVSRQGGYEDLVIRLDPDIGQQSCGHTLASIKVGAVSSEHLLKLGLSSKPLYKRAIAPCSSNLKRIYCDVYSSRNTNPSSQ